MNKSSLLLIVTCVLLPLKIVAISNELKLAILRSYPEKVALILRTEILTPEEKIECLTTATNLRNILRLRMHSPQPLPPKKYYSLTGGALITIGFTMGCVYGLSRLVQDAATIKTSSHPLYKFINLGSFLTGLYLSYLAYKDPTSDKVRNVFDHCSDSLKVEKHLIELIEQDEVAQKLFNKTNTP